MHHAPGQLVVATGEALVVEHAGTDDRAAGQQLVHSLGVGSLCCVPVHSDDQVIGALYVAHFRARDWPPRIVRLLGTIARAISSQIRLRGSLSRSRDHTDQLVTRLAASDQRQADLSTALGEARGRARRLQAGLLPPGLSAIPGADAAAAYVPGSGAEVAGDFYDLFRAGDNWCVVMGDVCGKGVEAAQIAALARYTIRATSTVTTDPAAILRRLDRALRTQFGRTYLTAAIVALRPDGAGGLTGTLGSAGHEPVLIRRANGEITTAGTSSTMLGVLDDPVLPTEPVHLLPGDLLLLYTDGVTEARPGPDAELFGDERLRTILSTCPQRTAEDAVQCIYTAVSDYAHGYSSDDTAILAVLATPPPAG